MSHFKRKRALQRRECLNSPDGLERHSQSVQPTDGNPDFTSEEKGVKILVDQEKLSSIDPWARLVGRTNEEQIVINGHPVTALLETGS